MQDLERAYKTITEKRAGIDRLYGYYDGEAPLKWSTERLRQAFESRDVYFSENWLSVVVSALLDRLVLKGFSHDSEKENSALNTLFTEENMQLMAFDVHEAGLVTGESYVITEKDEEGEVSAYFNDPRLCHVFYKADKPKVKDYAAKLWLDEAEERWHLNLFYPDRIEAYSANKNVHTAKGFSLDSSEPNETGKIPVFHFRNNRRNRGELGMSEISMQDAVNKLFSDMMVAAEFTAIKQRVIISQADPGDLKTFENWFIPDSDAKVQEIGGAELDNFLKAINDVAFALAAITKTPKHYFVQSGGDPSGEALITMESGLIKKVTQRQENYAVTWTELMSYLLELNGMTVETSTITPVWGLAATEQPLTSAQIIQVETSAGVPLVVAAKRRGWAQDEIDQLGNNSTRDGADANQNGRDAQEGQS
jgi:hypothetical protein